MTNRNGLPAGVGFSNLLDSMLDMVWVADESGECVWFNGAWLDFTGKNIRQEVGSGWLEGVHPDDRSRVMGIYLDHFERRLPFSMDYRILRYDGAYRTIRDIGSPLLEADGTFAGYFGCCRDIQDVIDEHSSLLESKAFIRALLDSAGVSILSVDEQGVISDANFRTLSMFGYNDVSELVGTPYSELISPAERASALSKIHALVSGDLERCELDRIFRRKDGSTFWGHVGATKLKLLNGDGPVSKGLVIIVNDIDERVKVEERLRSSAAVIDACGEGIVVVEADGLISFVNPAFEAVTGWCMREAVGKKPSILKSGLHDDAFYKNMYETLNSCGRWEGEIWNRRKSGETYPVWLVITNCPSPRGGMRRIGVFSDISARKAREDRLAHEAHTDRLTGLPNRSALESLLRRYCEGKEPFSVFFLDLDGFKAVNDQFGHAAGDIVLVEAAARISSCVRAGDMVARYGGDEFVAISHGVLCGDSCFVRRLDETMAPLFEPVPGNPLPIGASVGCASFPADGSSPEEILGKADARMYSAKRRRKALF